MQACSHPRTIRGFQCLHSVLIVVLLATGTLQESAVVVQPNAVAISDGTDLLAALNDTLVESIVLKGDVIVTERDTQAYKLPINLERNLTISSVADGLDPRTLDFGRVLQLLNVTPGHSLTVHDLVVQGLAPPSAAMTTGLSTELRLSPLWPTIDGAPGHELRLVNLEVTKVQTGCTPTLAQNMAGTFRRMLGRNDTVTSEGTTIQVQDTISLPAPVTDLVTKSQVGVAPTTLSNFTVHCEEDSAAVPSPVPPASPPYVHPYLHRHTGPGGDMLVNVSTGSQLLAALNDTEIGTINLEGDVTLSPAEAELYPLPFIMDSGRNTTIASATVGKKHTLDFGGILQLLYLDPGSTLVFRDLSVQGAAPPSAGAEETSVATEVRSGPLWPTVDGGPGHSLQFERCRVHHYQTGCTPELAAIQAKMFRKMLGHNNTVTQTGTSIAVAEALAMNFSVVDRITKEQLGLAPYILTNFTVDCSEDPAAVVPASDSSSSSSSSTWVWAVVGSLVGIAALAAATMALLLVRRRRRHAAAVPAAAQQLVNGAGSAGSSHVSAADPTAPKGVALSDSELKWLESAGDSKILESAGDSGKLSLSQKESSNLGEDSAASLGANLWHTRVGAIEGLELGDILGRGSFGRAYRGRWKGAMVAVKVIEQCIQAGKSYDLSREPLLSMSVSHPNVIMTYKLSVVCVKLDDLAESSHHRSASQKGSEMGTPTGSGRLGPAAAEAGAVAVPSGSSGSSSSQRQGGGSGRGSGGGLGGGRGSGGSGGEGGLCKPRGHHLVPGLTTAASGMVAGMVEVVSPYDVLPPGLYETWMVMEYADRGSLTDAIVGGRFFTPTRELDMAPVLLSLLDIAQGMDYLHNDLHIVHGDLKGRNVLLKTARADRRGFVCKLADFGLSRMLGQDQTHVDTKSFGTATHAAPELLQHGRMTTASDVYAFSIVMWEVAAGQEVYPDMTALQIIVHVMQGNERPAMPPHCPPALANLITRCWDVDPHLRPTFAEIVQELREMLKDVRRSFERAKSESAGLALSKR